MMGSLRGAVIAQTGHDPVGGSKWSNAWKLNLGLDLRPAASHDIGKLATAPGCQPPE
jgi:hypothetical protein